MKNRVVWVTWENQIRNKSMSARLGADFFPIVVNKSRIIRYVLCCYKTILLLRAYRKGTVYTQNPSVVLSLLAVLIKPLFRYKLIIDAHNSGVYPSSKLQSVCNFINRKADYVIVTNQGLAEFILSIGGRPLILPDPLPEIEVDDSQHSPWRKLAGPSVLVISSWAEDEPYCEVISAARLLPSVNFYITGNSKGRESKCNCDMPSNLILTGFVSEADYHQLLISADIIVDLTTRDDCLVCGAYEAIAVGKPVVLSDTNALRAYFQGSAVFVKNNASAIEAGLREILADYSQSLADAKENSKKIESSWQLLFQRFITSVNE